MKVYCYSKCSTCKKALAFLEEHHIAYELHDIKEEHPDAVWLEQWHKQSGLPLKKFFNTSGMLYKEKQLKDKLPNMSEKEQYDLLATDGMLIKRPLVIGEDFILTGFRQKEWEERLLF
ncbi:MAG: arsenate reductase family protein [Lachnospiraceae bacterium]|nr:arsenate reductase family protein [Lachnospiraceae bacterium]MDD3796849.1 arsenate reductase family protein [Lachnospiraceae bacterium]